MTRASTVSCPKLCVGGETSLTKRAPSHDEGVTTRGSSLATEHLYSTKASHGVLHASETMAQPEAPYSPTTSGSVYGSDGFEGVGRFSLGDGEFVPVLKAYPTPGISAEELRQAQRRLGTDAAALS